MPTRQSFAESLSEGFFRAGFRDDDRGFRFPEPAEERFPLRLVTTPLVCDFATGGLTAPPDISIFIPSPTVISREWISLLGKSRRNPLVGFGVVGTNTLVSFFPVDCSIWVDASVVTNPRT